MQETGKARLPPGQTHDEGMNVVREIWWRICKRVEEI